MNVNGNKEIFENSPASLADQLNQFIQQLPDAPEAESLKNYFQLLLAVVNNEDYQPYLEKVPEELKELVEKF